MPQIQIRRQGGAAIITIPAALLKQLHADMGSVLDMKVVDGALVAHPQRAKPRRRYTLAELLEGVTPEATLGIKEETEWFREGGPVGREIS